MRTQVTELRWLLIAIAMAVPTLTSIASGGTAPDTVFVELGRSDAGCAFLRGEHLRRIPGPPYVVSAAFNSGEDSVFIGICVNHMLPPMRTIGEKWIHDLTPQLVRRYLALCPERAIPTRSSTEAYTRIHESILELGVEKFTMVVDSTASGVKVVVYWDEGGSPWLIDMSDPIHLVTPASWEPLDVIELGRGTARALQVGRGLIFDGKGSVETGSWKNCRPPGSVR